ncbi:MAG: GNAT family N-acetyltransferase [Roseibium sp.]|uniref:GNAT family N-acetyltransferase n=1 Tax=Roseibium sp. TaxID=1936156 RepID=UPI003D9C333E
MNIRSSVSNDIPALQQIADSTGLFPSELLPEMMEPHLSGRKRNCVWLTCEVDDQAIGFCYAIEETFADGTWNMLALAVLPEQQGNGAGRTLVASLEKLLRSQNNRVLFVDTSGAESFAGTRSFYERCGYTEEARIRDFWAPGDDKVVFWKAL